MFQRTLRGGCYRQKFGELCLIESRPNFEEIRRLYAKTHFGPWYDRFESDQNILSGFRVVRTLRKEDNKNGKNRNILC